MTEKEEPAWEEKKPPERKKRKRGRRAYGTGSVFQRADRKVKQWVAQMILEDGTTKQRYFKMQEEAALALNEMLYEQRHGTLITEKEQTVKQHFERWLEVRSMRVSWKRGIPQVLSRGSIWLSIWL
jgi:hypothetical protein